MSLSARETIVALVEAKMKLILVASNYRTNAGQKVYLWRDPSLSAEELPSINLRDKTCETAYGTIGGAASQFEHRLTIEAEANAGITTEGAVSNVWVKQTAYGLGAMVHPTTANGHTYKCTTAGTSGATAPTWPTAAGGTVTDGNAVWTETTYTVPQVVRMMLQDIHAAIGSDPKWSANAVRTDPGGSEMDIAQKENIKGGASMTFTITYRTTAWGT